MQCETGKMSLYVDLAFIVPQFGISSDYGLSLLCIVINVIPVLPASKPAYRLAVYAHYSLLLIQIPVVDCGDPGTPSNGERNVSSTTYNSVVTYTCDVGYRLQGSNNRTCQSNGQWSGSVPQCTCKVLLLTDNVQ